MPEIKVDMSSVDRDVANDIAHDILLFFADMHDEGATGIEMIVALGIVMEIMIEEHNREMAHTRSH